MGRLFRVFAALLGIGTAHAQDRVYPVLVDTFTRPVLMGMHSSFGESLTRGRISVTQYLCLKAIPAQRLAPTVEDILHAALSEGEFAQAERFFSMPVGRRYAQAGMLNVEDGPKKERSELLQMLSLEDQAAIAAFAETPAGIRLFRDAALESPEAKDRLGRAIREVAEECRSK
jgi:hypothetical protein